MNLSIVAKLMISCRKPLEAIVFFSVLSDLLNSGSVKVAITQLCKGLQAYKFIVCTCKYSLIRGFSHIQTLNPVGDHNLHTKVVTPQKPPCCLSKMRSISHYHGASLLHWSYCICQLRSTQLTTRLFLIVLNHALVCLAQP